MSAVLSLPGRARRIGAALLACLSLSFAAAAAPAETVVVTGSREPLAASRLAADAVVIDETTVRGSAADSLADLLRREAGVQLSRNGGPGHATAIFIRGAASTQSIVLVDGVRVGSATLGYAALEALPLAQVERIEVLRGPGSSLYGADAVGGVVQVFTRSAHAAPEGLHADAQLAVGGYGTREAALALRGRQGAVDLAATLSGERTTGVSALRPGDLFGNFNPDRDGHHLGAGQLRLGWQAAPGQRLGLMLLRSKLDSQYDASEFPPPAYAQDPSPDFRTRLTTQAAALDWRGEFGAGWVASARASRNVDDSKDGGNRISRFRSAREQLGAQLAAPAGVLGRWVLSAERLRDEAASSSYAGDAGRTNNAFVAELTGAAGPWSWQADLRRDDNSAYGAVNTGRLGGAFAFAPGWRLRALAGSTFRAPSYNELVFPGYGVPTLRPERGRSAELGLGWRGQGAEAAATLWRNRVRDLIGYTSDAARCPADPAYAFGCAANTAQARLRGLTLSGRQVLGAFALRAQFDALKATDAATGVPLPRRAERQGTLALDWQRGAFSAGAALVHLGSRPDGGKTLAAETTLDLQAGWRPAPGWQLQAKLANAGDARTEPARDYQGFGRQAWLMLRREGL